MITALLVLAGGVGAAARFLVDGMVARLGPFRVPMGTLVINVSGSFVLGCLTGWVVFGPSGTGASSGVRAVLGTGFCGGYTTFSTASVEVVRLWNAEGRTSGLGYALTSLVGSVIAAGLGLWVGSLFG